jgi:hypothetical protein
MVNICRKCGCDFPNWQKIGDRRVNLGSRAYCLNCSPYKAGRGRGNRIRLENYSSIDGVKHKRCIECTQRLPLCQFYSYRDERGRSQFSGRCKSCMSNRVIKEQAIAYKGGSCLDCAGQFHYSVFDFHHLDPSEKDMNVMANHPKSLEAIKSELDKCVLLCSNCHRLRHNDPSNKHYSPLRSY